METTSPFTSTSLEPSTFHWEENSSRLTRRVVYYSLHGFVGFLISLFNGTVILVYTRRQRMRDHISTVMLAMFAFCFIHGLIVGIVYPLQRVYRYVMGTSLCVLTTLLMDFADKYVVLLLPVLAIERLLFLKFPFVKSTDPKAKWLARCTVGGLLLFAMLYAWLPLWPKIGVREEEYISSNNTKRQIYLERFYKHYTCHGKLNKMNSLEPIFTLIVSCLCVTLVIAAYVWMFCIAMVRLTAFPNITKRKKRRLKKAAKSVLVVAVTFIFTMLPYGIIVQIAVFCGTDTSFRENSNCNGITLELRFMFSILAHLGNLFAPLLFAVLNQQIWRIIHSYVGNKLKWIKHKVSSCTVRRRKSSEVEKSTVCVKPVLSPAHLPSIVKGSNLNVNMDKRINGRNKTREKRHIRFNLDKA